VNGRILFCLSCLLASATAWPVEVYRCVAPDGSVSFQQGPCAGTGERVEPGEVQAAWTGLRAGERRLYHSYRRRDRERARAGRIPSSRSAANRKNPESVTCYNKRHALDEVQARLRTGYGPGEGEKLRRRRDYLEGYLEHYCS